MKKLIPITGHFLVPLGVGVHLRAWGVSPERISVSAHGESAAQDDSLDSYALERRVALTLFIDSGEPQPMAQSLNR